MSQATKRLPPWVANRTGLLARGDVLKRRLRSNRLVTVCEEARCPNLGECFSRGTATFMLLGQRCTRSCSFCSVDTGRPLPPDLGEPDRVAAAAASMGLAYVVITSVNRDDLPDEGAGQFAATVRALRRRVAGVEVEVLTPDFNGREELVELVLDSHPEVFGHNLETVARLTPEVRGRARYDRSLGVLCTAASRCRRSGQGLVKTALMVGLGEQRAELGQALQDIYSTGCRLIAIGQYLRPTRAHREVSRYVEPSEFEEIECEAREIGFDEVACGPLVRSSYRAESLYAAASSRSEVRV
ncbi:MAG: lipoyl synthase [Deltaproteobacteria bacterium]